MRVGSGSEQTGEEVEREMSPKYIVYTCVKL